MLLDVQIVLQNFFDKLAVFEDLPPPQSGYRKLRRRNSLRQISFSGLYDASLARNNEISVFDLDLGRKTTSPLTVNHAQLQAAMRENHANQCVISKSRKAFNSMQFMVWVFGAAYSKYMIERLRCIEAKQATIEDSTNT